MIVLTHRTTRTTTVYNRQSLEILREFVIRHDLILVCDQAFEDFCYENEMITPAAMEGMFERTVTVFSFSKGMGLSGSRVGYLVSRRYNHGRAVCQRGFCFGRDQYNLPERHDRPRWMIRPL